MISVKFNKSKNTMCFNEMKPGDGIHICGTTWILLNTDLDINEAHSKSIVLFCPEQKRLATFFTSDTKQYPYLGNCF